MTKPPKTIQDKQEVICRIDTKTVKKPSIRNILVPIDFSKISIQAIETAKKENAIAPGCFSAPTDWILAVKSGPVAEIDFLFSDDGA